MNRTQVISFALVLLVTVATLVQGRFLADARSKRQSADVRTAEYLAWIALGGGDELGPGCEDIACGIVDVDKRLKRTSSDQRIAELQALIAMSRGGAIVGHGQIDPYKIGKKKRDARLGDNISDIQRFRLLRTIYNNMNDQS